VTIFSRVVSEGEAQSSRSAARGSGVSLTPERNFPERRQANEAQAGIGRRGVREVEHGEALEPGEFAGAGFIHRTAAEDEPLQLAAETAEARAGDL
jgi:hypothetical protein